MTTFIRLHEYNDWEGEQWNWWLGEDADKLYKGGICTKALTLKGSIVHERC